MAFGDLKGTLQGSNSSIPNPFSATGSVSVAVGDLILAVICQRTSVTATACTDNASNSYTALGAGTDGGNATTKAFYFRATSAFTLTSVSWTTTSGADDVVGMVAVIEGPFTTSPLDAQVGGGTDTTLPLSCPATGTLAQADEVVLGWIGCSNGKTDITGGNPNSNLVLNVATGTATNTIGGAIARQTVIATTSITIEFTAASAPASSALETASFKKGTATTPALHRMFQVF